MLGANEDEVSSGMEAEAPDLGCLLRSIVAMTTITNRHTIISINQMLKAFDI